MNKPSSFVSDGEDAADQLHKAGALHLRHLSNGDCIDHGKNGRGAKWQFAWGGVGGNHF